MVMPVHISNVYDEQMKAVEDEIDLFSAHSFCGNEVGAVLDDAVSTKGKRIRPKLLLLVSEFGSERKIAAERLHKLAAIVELTHLASLIHDVWCLCVAPWPETLKLLNVRTVFKRN